MVVELSCLLVRKLDCVVGWFSYVIKFLYTVHCRGQYIGLIRDRTLPLHGRCWGCSWHQPSLTLTPPAPACKIRYCETGHCHKPGGLWPVCVTSRPVPVTNLYTSQQFFAGNYSHDRRFEKSDWLCFCKEAREDESHLTSGQCKVYGDLCENFTDLTDDESLVQFFIDVLARRDMLEKLE